ncbi:5-(carboxyamino)imidazole ribonucleotide synthase [Microbacterium karelineae]|uniref:5-(carboxyamino)imidazole ribonucleotide synthase n=1 Tax=Microbacterium karelineae TaxID=2654283 RepID=UPI0012EA215C|nr:5-(carboxyamino)imidazole ribonucleotide synthase [Microbacterium karelineae]
MTKCVGVVGGGQLARMMIAPAVELGIEIRVLAEQDGMAARLAATATGDYRDIETVRAFARDVDVITFDHEHVPQEVLRALVDDGVAVHPGPDALRFAQDKLVMRAKLAEIGAPQPDWAGVATRVELQAFLDDHGGRAVVKTPRGGYDGKGVRVVRDASEADDWFDAFAGERILVEELVDFRRELAQQIARSPRGEMTHYPVVETVQKDGVCAEVFAPAPQASERAVELAARIGNEIAHGLGVTGMLAVELFETTDERLLVNELAMRPHNSGHWTQDGAVTCQFEQHLRAVLDLPLGSAEQTADATCMVNILGGPAGISIDERFEVAMRAHPEAKIHTYGKASRPGRKVGHVNVASDDIDDAAYVARAAAAHFE